jgi:aminoglycoside phosphotransferase (APT) family kinase protein
MVSIPRATIDATPEFVTDALRSGGTIGADTRVAEVEHCTIGEGVGVMGTLARLTLRFSGPAVRAPSSVIIKLPSEFPESRGVGNHFRLYEREGRFYEQLGDKLSVRTPHCYFNHVDLEGDEFALLLEDFAGRTMVSQLEGISPDRAAEVIRTIATVHAEWWASPALDSLTWMPDIEAPEVTTAGEHYRIYWPKLLELVGDELPDGSVELGGLIGSAWEETQATFGKLNPVTLCHGDLRADNLMFDDSAEGQERVGLLDWQVSARLGGLWDVAYLLTQSMTVENRRSADRDLISLWYDLITSALGSSPNGFTLDDAWREYRRAAGNLTVYMVVAGANADFSIERIRQLVSAGAERSFTAALDLDSASLLGS